MYQEVSKSGVTNCKDFVCVWHRELVIFYRWGEALNPFLRCLVRNGRSVHGLSEGGFL